ncbi:MAG: hypothetical protein OEZ01_00710, partial [Candidatus Heimdallarchaeota archaeon]|nr:hypothetical protein [Candidatus Heimdallarchaeota archaeon]
MTYIESALGDFIKNILTRGIRTLKSPRYAPYSIFLLIIVIISTVSIFLQPYFNIITDDTIDLMLFLEISVATSFVLVGL